jgi:hypothetical protein
MPTVRVTDTAGQDFNEEPVVDDDEPIVRTPAEPAREAAEAMTALVEPAASTPGPGFSSEQTAAIERLRRLGKRRMALRRELEGVERELLGDAIIGAFKLGVPKRVIARESLVVRQTVYNVIERA